MVGKTQTSNVQNPPKSVLFWTSVSAKKMANNSLIFPLFKSQNCHAFLVLVSDFDTSGHFNHKACFMQSNHIQAFRNCLRFLEPCLPPTTVRDLMVSQSNQRFFHKNYELLACYIIVGKAEGLGRIRAGLVSGVWVLLLFVAVFGVVLNVSVASVQSGTIYIRADGSIDPPTAPIFSSDNITYIFTNNIYDEMIMIQKDDVIIEGLGYKIQGYYDPSSYTIGIDLSSRTNVTVRNTIIAGFLLGIYLQNSHYNILSNNSLLNNGVWGIYLYASNFNYLSANSIKASSSGIELSDSSNNTICNNVINKNEEGIWLDVTSMGSSTDNVLSNNTIFNNEYGLKCLSYNNTIYHNSFINNTIQLQSIDSPDATNTWDNGYPSGGSYWSDYGGNDSFCGPFQNETGTDGIGDTAYVINENNRDNYPLMSPKTSVEYRDLQLRLRGSPSFPQPGYLYYLNVTVENIGLNSETGVQVLILINETVAFSINVTLLRGGESYELSYSWFPKEGTFNITAHTPVLSGEKFIEDNVATVWLIVGGPAHNINTGFSYPTIQDAIDAEETVEGHTIEAEPGTYYERLTIDKSIVLSGKDKNTTIIDGGEAGTVVNVAASNVTICGFTIKNSGTSATWEPARAGVYLSSANYCTICNNTLLSNENGVLGRGSSNTIVANSVLNSQIGIYLFSSSSNNEIGNNTIMNTGSGIYLTSSGSNTIRCNFISGNGAGVGVFPYDCYSTTIIDNIVLNHSYSIWLSGCAGNTLANNTLIQGDTGIYLSRSNTNDVIEGNIIANLQNGISKMPGDPMGDGFKIYHNSFINNLKHVCEYSLTNALWDNGYPSGGNYWDDYDKEDVNGDSIGDSVYIIDAYNQDQYPLTTPREPIPVVWEGLIYPIRLKSNSTVSGFRLDVWQRTMSFNATGVEGTIGFCNITIPNTLLQNLWQNNYSITVDGEPPLTLDNWTDSACTYVHFTYQHSKHEIVIVQEFSSILILLLFMTATLLAVIVYRRKRCQTDWAE